ncbi:unnamed protein product [Symbiodinium microadriaticum]|nr:unnamed protein product [Symbiodinium microadriaticum]
MARLVNSLNVYNALIVLLNHYFSIVNTVQPRRVAPTLQSPSPPFSAGNHLEVWAPSEKDIAAAVVYAVSGLCCNGTLPKVCFLSCSAARASTHLELTGGAESSSVITPAAASNSSGDLGSLCYRLLTMALFRGNKTPFRVFSVQFLESFMRGVDHGASGAASRIVLSTSIVKALRDSLNCSSASLDCLPPEVFAALLDALASALLPPICQLHQKQREIDVSPCSITDRFRSPTTNGSASLSSKSASGASSLEPVITIPELTAWICDRYLRESSTVMCALLRLLARFGDEESYAHVPAARKLHANVLSTKVILVVWRCITESSDIDVRSLAILSMWTILHASESARAVLKRARTSGELVDMDLMKVQVTGELCSRAREVLCQLWR